MKKIVTLIALMLCLGANAQQADTLATFAVGEQEDITLKGSDAQGGVTLAVAGYNIKLAQPEAEKRPDWDLKTRKRVFTMGESVQLGLASLAPADYSAYSANDAGFLDGASFGKSIYFGVNIASLQLGIDRQNKFVFKTGVDSKNYFFRLGNSTSIAYSDGMMRPVTLESEKKKSLFSSSYFVLPLAFEYNPSKKLSFEVKGYAGFLIGSYSKYKKPKVKAKGLEGLNPYIGGATLSATYSNVGIYCDYAITELFKKGQGPATNAISFGLTIGL